MSPKRNLHLFATGDSASGLVRVFPQKELGEILPRDYKRARLLILILRGSGVIFSEHCAAFVDLFLASRATENPKLARFSAGLAQQ